MGDFSTLFLVACFALLICLFVVSSIYEQRRREAWLAEKRAIAEGHRPLSPEGFFELRNSYKGHMQDFDFMGCYVIHNLTNGMYYVGQAMLNDCRAGKIQRILVKSVSRFARNTLELIETTRELKDLGVVVVFEEQGIDTAQMLGEMQLTLLAMAAQEESTSISKNMRWSYLKRMEAGRYITTKAPYG